MNPSRFRHLRLVPAQAVMSDPSAIPDVEGVYYVFLEPGLDLLRASSYFDFATREPLVHAVRTRVYTGASNRLRSRIKCHLTGGAEQSGLRKTLVSLELARNAITRSGSDCFIGSFTRRTLDAWLLRHALFAAVPCEDSCTYEKRLLRRIVSPLNIRGQKTPDYAAQLLGWRNEFFPRDGSF